MREMSENPSLRILWDMKPSPEVFPVLDWLQSRGWCWGMGVPPDTSEEMLREIRKRGWTIVQEIHAHPVTRERQFKPRYGETPDLREVLQRAMSVAGEDFVWQLFLEDDSAGVGFPYHLLKAKPDRHAQAKMTFDRYLDEAMTEAEPYAHLERWGVAGFASSAHAYAKRGLNCVIVERSNDDVEDLQTAIAFARGASRQYGCQWGIDLSLWWGVFFGCVTELPASFHERHLVLSHFSGAQVLRIEGGNLLYSTATAQPSLLARSLDHFARAVIALDPGTPDVPVAVMLPEDHGWITPPYWASPGQAWNYARVRYRPGDRGIDGFFGAAFPGSVYAMDPFPLGAYQDNAVAASPFALSCISRQYAPTEGDTFEAIPYLPFGRYRSRDEARKDMQEKRADPSDYRPMGDSRWGDILDVLTDSASLQVLKGYPVLVLLGAIPMTEDLRSRLQAYVESGGTLLCAAGAVGPQDASWLGVTLEPEMRVGRMWRWKEEPWSQEAFRYIPARIALPSEAQILAETRQGDPLIVRRTLGQGSICLCLVSWYEAGHAPLSRVALRLFDEVFEGIQPVRIEGPPLEWLSQRGAHHRTVVVANHDSVPWEGQVILRHLDTEYSECRDVLTGQAVDFRRQGNSAHVSLIMPGYSTTVLRWTSP